jgi:hypothetical protein
MNIRKMLKIALVVIASLVAINLAYYVILGVGIMMKQFTTTTSPNTPWVLPTTLEETCGNHTFIYFRPLISQYSDGKQGEMKVLVAKDEFERNHPELEITGWQVESTQSTFCGIWVDHKPSGKQPLTRDHVVPAPK